MRQPPVIATRTFWIKRSSAVALMLVCGVQCLRVAAKCECDGGTDGVLLRLPVVLVVDVLGVCELLCEYL